MVQSCVSAHSTRATVSSMLSGLLNFSPNSYMVITCQNYRRAKFHDFVYRKAFFAVLTHKSTAEMLRYKEAKFILGVLGGEKLHMNRQASKNAKIYKNPLCSSLLCVSPSRLLRPLRLHPVVQTGVLRPTRYNQHLIPYEWASTFCIRQDAANRLRASGVWDRALLPAGAGRPCSEHLRRARRQVSAAK